MSSTERCILSIDAPLLAQAQQYYAEHGYQDAYTPWIVEDDPYSATLPPEHEGLKWAAKTGGYHVASAEQGFMQLMRDNKYIPPKAQSTTPCFRGEPVYDELHLPFFYKLELYNADTSNQSLQEMIACARGLFTQLGIDTRVVKTAERAFDIETAKTHIELGSYGVRAYHNYVWLYGTGLALPRATQARAKELEAAQLPPIAQA